MADHAFPSPSLAARLHAAKQGVPDLSPLRPEEGESILTGLRARIAAAPRHNDMHEYAAQFLRTVHPAVPHAASQMEVLADLPDDVERPRDPTQYATYLLAYSMVQQAEQEENDRVLALPDEEFQAHQAREEAKLNSPGWRARTHDKIDSGAAWSWLRQELQETRLNDPVAQANRAEDEAMKAFEDERVAKASAPIWARRAAGEITALDAFQQWDAVRRQISDPHGRHTPWFPPEPPQSGPSPKGLTR